MARRVFAFAVIHDFRASADGARPMIPAIFRASRTHCSGIRRSAFQVFTVWSRSLQNLLGAASTVEAVHSVFTEEELARLSTRLGEAVTVEAVLVVTVVAPIVGGVYVSATLAHLPPPHRSRGFAHNHIQK